MLAGNVVALLSPLVFIPVLTYVFGPQNYDWKSMQNIRLGDDKELADAAHVDIESIPGRQGSQSVAGATGLSPEELAAEQASLKRSAKIAGSLTLFLTIALLVLWPMPMFGTSYVFSKQFFTGWVVVGIIWLFFSAFCVGLFPLWEGRLSMLHTFRAVIRDLSGKPVDRQRVVVEGLEEPGEEEKYSGDGVPVEIGEKVKS
jgi:urea-proton symporter